MDQMPPHEASDHRIMTVYHLRDAATGNRVTEIDMGSVRTESSVAAAEVATVVPMILHVDRVN
jgi:hypothetical protein